MRMDMTPGLELTPEQQLELVYFHVADEGGKLAQLSHAVVGNGHPEDGLVSQVREIRRVLVRKWWESLAYDVARAVLIAVVLAAIGLMVLGARVQLTSGGLVPR